DENHPHTSADVDWVQGRSSHREQHLFLLARSPFVVRQVQTLLFCVPRIARILLLANSCSAIPEVPTHVRYEARGKILTSRISDQRNLCCAWVVSYVVVI